MGDPAAKAGTVTPDEVTDAGELRDRYKPADVRTLFVGESSPAQGTHFYRANSNLYRATRAAYAAALGEDTVPSGEAFLRFLADQGAWLVDLADEPVNRMADVQRRATVEAGIPQLAETIRTERPNRVVVVKRDIAEAVRRAVVASGIEPDVTVLPFPVRQWAPVYTRELAALLGGSGKRSRRRR